MATNQTQAPDPERTSPTQQGQGGSSKQTQGNQGQSNMGQGQGGAIPRQTSSQGSRPGGQGQTGMSSAGEFEDEMEEESMGGFISGSSGGAVAGTNFNRAIDPSEDAYWREQYARRPYFRAGRSYEDYEPAYRLGYRAAEAVHGGSIDDQLDEDLHATYDQWRAKSKLEWDEARAAVRDAFTHRAQRSQQRKRPDA